MVKDAGPVTRWSLQPHPTKLETTLGLVVSATGVYGSSGGLVRGLTRVKLLAVAYNCKYVARWSIFIFRNELSTIVIS